MPGRVSGRSTRTSGATAVSRKSSTTTLKSRASSARTSAYAVEIPDEGPSTSLRAQICRIFADAQRSTATQRKLVVNLRKVQEACCYEPTSTKKAKKGEEEREEFDEEQFNEEVGRCVLRMLSVKKSEPVGDRLVRFLGLFLKHGTEKDNAIHQPEDGDTTEGFPETPSSRLTTHILTTALGFLTAKDKTVRFRSTQIVAHIVNTLDTIDDELFDLIRIGLSKRLRDKEPSVRVQTVLGLGRLADENADDDDEDSDDDAAGGIMVKLLDLMQNDPAAEVRRSLLLNLPFAPSTLQYLLERARDTDVATRRALYGKLLPALGDFRHMSLIHREKLLRWGFRDRDEGVRKATARLFSQRWIEDCASSHAPPPAEGDEEQPKQPGQVASPNMDALLELLERIDVERSGAAEGMAHEAMREFWEARPDYREFVTFDDDYWNDLSPESAFIARSLNDYCHTADDNRLQGLVEDKLPEVTKCAFFVQRHLNVLIEYVRKVALQEDQDQELEDEANQQEFVVEQLLHIALTLDYTDEIGRRQMFSIMREALALAELPEECTRLAVEVLRTVCGSRDAAEREFCAVVHEAIAEVHDTIISEDEETEQNPDDSFHSAQSELSDSSAIRNQSNKQKKVDEDPEVTQEKHFREVLVNLKCLHIAQCMLQNVHCDLEQNDALVTMLNTLIVPAVRSHEAVIRERALVCLGLCCLLSKDLALSNLDLFIHCFTKGHETLQTIAIQVLTDTVITHPSLLAPPAVDPNVTVEEDTPPEPNRLLRPLTKVFLKGLSSNSASMPLMSTVAASKLLLMNLLPAPSSTDLIKAFTLAYFNPETATDPALRQALSYFLPVFCHSKLQNAILMTGLAVPILSKLLLVREEIDEEEEEMVGWAVITGHLAEWTDGRKVVGGEFTSDGKTNFVDGADEPHILLAIEILERALSHACSKDERKPLLMLLGKLYISSSAPAKGETVGEEIIKTLHELVAEAVEGKLGVDVTTRNLLSKLEITMTKRVGDVEHVIQTELPDATEVPEEDTIRAARSSATPEAEAEATTDATVAYVTEGDMPDEEEDTMMAGMQAEGTRLPLGGSDEDSDGTVTGRRSRGSRTAITEDDIVESLLDSEI